jgi:hypothetical protein
MNPFLAIGLGAITGWALAKYLREAGLVRNPEWRIKYDDLDDNLGDVFVGKQLIGSVLNMGIPGQKKAWQAGDWRDLPMSGGYSTADAAAASVYKVWVQHRQYEKAAAKAAKPAPDILGITVPDWVKDVEVESASGSMPDRFVVWVGDEAAGYIDRRGKNWDAHFRFESGSGVRSIQLETDTTRKRAVTAVYCAFKLFENVSAAVTPGKEQHYFPRRYSLLPPLPLKPGQTEEQQGPPRQVEEFYTTLHPFQQTAGQISAATKIPKAEVERYAKKLAENRVIYGVMSKERTETFKRVESLAPVSRRGAAGRPRRIVSTVDIRKLRKSEQLTAAEKRALPRVKSERGYKFALIGPTGEVGLHG